MDIAVKLVFDLLAFTSVMVLIVLGLGVSASMMGIFNFAHGEFVLLGAYTMFLVQESGMPAWIGIIAAPVVVAHRAVVVVQKVAPHRRDRRERDGDDCMPQPPHGERA